MLQDITTPLPCLRVFPEPDTVFAAPVDQYARHLMPLVSIDLSAVNPAWQGWIHLVNPCEPASGQLGQDTAAFHNGYLQPNWIAFRLNAQDKYELLGDWRYFYLENPQFNRPDPQYQAAQREQADAMRELFAQINHDMGELGEDVALDGLALPHFESAYQELAAHYEQQHAGYARAKARFQQHGKLFSQNQFSDDDTDFAAEPSRAFLEQLGGQASGGNWATSDAVTLVKNDDWQDTYPVGPNGKRFYFIAHVPGWNYCAQGADSILLFYEPEQRIAWLTFDWT